MSTTEEILHAEARPFVGQKRHLREVAHRLACLIAVFSNNDVQIFDAVKCCPSVLAFDSPFRSICPLHQSGCQVYLENSPRSSPAIAFCRNQ